MDLILFQLSEPVASNPVTPALIGLAGACLGAFIATLTQVGLKLYELKYGTNKLVIEQKLKALTALNDALAPFIPEEQGPDGKLCHLLFVAPRGQYAGSRVELFESRNALKVALAAGDLWIGPELEQRFQALIDLLTPLKHVEHGKNMQSLENMSGTTSFRTMFPIAERLYAPLKKATERCQLQLKEELKTLHNVNDFLTSSKW